MSSLEEEISVLEKDLAHTPVRISAYHDLPFAIFRYDPWEEFPCRKRMRLLAISLEQNYHKKVIFISLGRILWEVIRQTEGLDGIVAEERQLGFERTQTTIHNLLSEKEFLPVSDVLLSQIKDLDPEKDLVFLGRAGTLAPSIFRCSALLDQMHGQTMVPIVLFYPGTAEGTTDLRFMGMHERANLGAYNYRVKIYGGN